MWQRTLDVVGAPTSFASATRALSMTSIGER
jgi:hypothetical protein